MLNTPGSSMGYKHTEENLLKMSDLKKVLRAPARSALDCSAGEKNPMFNKIKSDNLLFK